MEAHELRYILAERDAAERRRQTRRTVLFLLAGIVGLIVTLMVVVAIPLLTRNL